MLRGVTDYCTSLRRAKITGSGFLEKMSDCGHSGNQYVEQVKFAGWRHFGPIDRSRNLIIAAGQGLPGLGCLIDVEPPVLRRWKTRPRPGSDRRLATPHLTPVDTRGEN